jgi:SAM-dependent methyltransferase
MMATSLYIDGRYELLHPTWHAEDSAWKARQVLEILRRNDLSPRSVCEVGCGAGGILRALQPELASNCKLVGYEISPQAHARCAAHANEGLRFVLGDFLDEPHRDFDLLLCMDVVEHVEDYLGFLRKIRGRARQKMFHVPLDLSAQGILREVPEAVRKSAGHIHYFTRRIFLDVLRETGYRVLDWSYTPAATELPARSLAMACARWPRKLMYTFSPEVASRMLGGYSLLVLAE